MQLTIASTDDLSLACQGWAPPPSCTEVVVDAPRVRQFTNMFLRSPLNVRVRVTPTELEEVSYAGLFSMCENLTHQPFVDTTRCVNMAAMFKGMANARFSLHSFKTGGVRDMRQMLWGCASLSGNGIDSWDFSAVRSPDGMRHFAGGTAFKPAVYDRIILSLYRQAMAKTLPRPMHHVDFGRATFSRLVAAEREYLIRYGWDIKDGGPHVLPVQPSKLEEQFRHEVDDRLEAGRSPVDGVDMSPVLRRSRGGIMVTTRHCLHTNHHRLAVGDTVTSWSGDTAQIMRVDFGAVNVYGADAVLSTLDRDLPVTPCMMLPADWQTACPMMAQKGPPSPYRDDIYPPLVWIDQRDRVRLVDLAYVNSRTPDVQCVVPEDPLRAALYAPAILGDSGSPACWVHEGRLVLSHVVAMGGAGIGPAAFVLRPWIDEVVGRTSHHVIEV